MFLDQSLLPLKDYHKAKKLMWNPRDLDYTQDKADWDKLDEGGKDLIRRVLSLFLAGETYVTHDLAPLLVALRHEGGHLEEEMFLTAQLFEESKHVEYFNDVLEQVVGEVPQFDTIAGNHYKSLFVDELSSALDRLLTDHSKQAQIDAVATYHMTIEGVVAETGYYGVFIALKKNNIMPSTVKGLEYVQRDEARHVAFGLYLLKRIISENPDLKPQLDGRLNHLLPMATGIVSDLLEPFLPNIPLGLDLNDVLGYAMTQYQARINVLNRA